MEGQGEKAMKYATLLEKGLWHRCFPMDFAKFPIIPFLQNTSEWLFLFLKTSWNKNQPVETGR